MPRGGKRAGAGRPVVKLSRVLRPVKKVTAEEILSKRDEEAEWNALLDASDVTSVYVVHDKQTGEEETREQLTVPAWKIRLEALKYLTDRRDGKPRQAVDYTDDRSPLDFGSLPTPPGDSRTTGKPN